MSVNACALAAQLDNDYKTLLLRQEDFKETLVGLLDRLIDECTLELIFETHRTAKLSKNRFF